jgi:hypothetical protein
MRDQRRDHLGVARDLRRDPEPIGDLEVGEVVDVTVEHRRDIRNF